MTTLEERAQARGGRPGRRTPPLTAEVPDGYAELPANRGLIKAGLVLAGLMSALDTTVVNVAMPNMQGDLSASPEQITWVISSYIVAMAVMTPLSGWLAARIGLKLMVMMAIIGFTITSVLCGLATSLPEMVVFRILQGFTAAALSGMLQAIFLNISPPSEYGRSMALYTTSILFAPVLGPAVGGFLTEYASWRWCFFINVPGGIISLLLIWAFLPEGPVNPRRFDMLGYGAIAIAIGAFQLMLDRGATLDWFTSREIWIEALIAGGAFWIYVTHTLTAKHPLFPAALASNRNLMICVAFHAVYTMFLYASMTLMPMMMQGIMGYSPMYSGELNVPRGLVTLAVLQVMGRIDGMFDRRLLVALGVAIVCLGYWRMSQFDLSMTSAQIVEATLLQGLGSGIIFVPLSTLGFGTVRPELRPDAASFSTLFRTLGGSLGVAVAQALTTANSQSMHASLAAHVQPDNPVFRAGLPPFLSPDTVEGALALNAEISRQAMMVAYVDNYRLMAFLGLLCTPLLLLLRTPKRPEFIAEPGS
jgi:DHA2 family multidrug resistance protein